MKAKEFYGPEVKYKKGLDELLEGIASYGDQEGSVSNPFKFICELLASGQADILEIGSGWEKETVEAFAEYGAGINWVSVNPMLQYPEHNRRVMDQIDEHIWSPHIKRALEDMGIDAPPRKAVAAESASLPFRDQSFDLALASWSVPTVLEEQVAGKQLDHGSKEYQQAWSELIGLVAGTCREYCRLIRPEGAVITFPIRDYTIVEEMKRVLDEGGSWEHTVGTVDDFTYYTNRSVKKVNYILMSRRISGDRNRELSSTT